MKQELLSFTVICALPASLLAQAPAQGAPPPQSAKAAAPMDLTGNWVSIVTEDYRWRMVTPLKGDSASVPVNAEGRKVVNSWDPAKDETAGLQCKAYGAPAIMRIPGRLRISWADDNTLKIETDAGTQTRLFHFGGQPPASMTASWQGYSAARWEPGPGRYARGGLGATVEGNESRSLEVFTNHLRAGYLRKNGVPYSEQATVREYYDRFSEPNGEEWFTVTTVVTDPAYLIQPFVTTTDFKREPDGSKFSPSACTSR
jgi:hypothetical protein